MARLDRLSLAQRLGDSALLPIAHGILGNTLNYLGELVAARTHCEHGMRLYAPQQYRSQAFLYGFDPGAVCLSYAALILWLLGYPDQAWQRSREALALAHQLAHPQSLAFALVLTALLHQCRREGQAICEQAEAAIQLATAHGFTHWLGLGTILRGWALVEQGQGVEGIVEMHAGLATWRATGARGAGPGLLVLLGEAYGKTGQVEEGLRVFAEALALTYLLLVHRGV